MRWELPPGMWFEQNGTYWMSMPGVPHEMKKLMKDFVLPKLPTLFELPVIYHKVIKTAGIGESWLADMINDWGGECPSRKYQIGLPPFFGTCQTALDRLWNKPSGDTGCCRKANPAGTSTHSEIRLRIQ